MTNPTQNENDIREWMEDVAKKKEPRKKLVFDKKTRRLVAQAPTEIPGDQNLQFTSEEATRYI
jgi:hypothetical protein